MTPHTYINFDKKYKKDDRKFRKYKIIAGVAGFLILLGGIFYAIAYSPLPKIKNLSVVQANIAVKQIDTDKLAGELKDFFANRSKITKFLGADNILIWTEGGLAKFSKSPEIEEISMKKDYAERTVEISVKLRERFGVWCQNQLTTNNQQLITNGTSTEQQITKSCWWFDKNGVLFAMAPELEGNAINKVDDFSGRNLKLGDFILNENLTPNAIKIFNVLERSGLGIRALKLENLALQEIIFEKQQSSLPKIYFSLRFDPEFALAAINDLKKIGLEKIEYIDLRVENRAYYKPQ